MAEISAKPTEGGAVPPASQRRDQRQVRRGQGSGCIRQRLPHLRLAARPPHRQGCRRRRRGRQRHRPARPRRQGRCRGGDRRRRRQGSARGQAGAAARTAPRRAVKPMSDEAVLKLFEPGSYELVPHDNMRKTIARRLVEAKSTIPHFYLTLDCEIDALLALRAQLNAAAPDEEDRQGRGPDLQALGQRHDHQGDGAGAARRAGRQRLVDRQRHGQAQARRCRRRRVDPRRADHADHPACRRKDAVGDLQRDEGSRRARPQPQAEARGISGRHDGGLQSRHVRRQGLCRRHQPAACDHPGGRRRRGAGRGQEGRDRRSPT